MTKSVAVAVRLDARGQERVIRHAAEFARAQGLACYAISIVRELPYGDVDESGVEVVLHNLQVIREECASPVIQEGSEVARLLMAVARSFGVTTLFVQSGRVKALTRSIAEQLIYMDPPFSIAVVASDEQRGG